MSVFVQPRHFHAVNVTPGWGRMPADVTAIVTTDQHAAHIV
jgi:hypothetical protein